MSSEAELPTLQIVQLSMQPGRRRGSSRHAADDHCLDVITETLFAGRCQRELTAKDAARIIENGRLDDPGKKSGRQPRAKPGNSGRPELAE